MRAVAIVGPKKAGKTTLGLALAEALAEMGLKVVAAKHTGHHFDKQGTDTARYAEHCAAVIGLGPEESFVTWPVERHLPDLLPLARADVLLVEGGKGLRWLPRVLVLNEPGEAQGLAPELTLACFGNTGPSDLPRVESVGELARLVLERGFVLPGLDCGACGREDCGCLAAEIVAGRALIDECKSRSSRVRVAVNGSPVGLNPFLERLFCSMIGAMLEQLKGYAPGRVSIELEP
ncbi:MAG: molybdopterin-guanine dinucleotide biosynthesis protein MobB [Desulfovibrionaceae bacterium]|nr:molybdopterin-guanine dinucleotide biosynthesis protein MobB [Desulfovibrionaceae bacterium]